MSLEASYENAQRMEDATVARIRAACNRFMSETPQYLPSSRNESILFATMRAHDELSPTSAASWKICYDLSRDQLTESPTARRQSPAASSLTKEIINSWSAERLRKEIESSPQRGQEIEVALSRR